MLFASLIDDKYKLPNKNEGVGRDETIATKKVAAYDPNVYKGFGAQGEDAYKSGWMPQESPMMGKRIFTNQYSNAFNQVKIPNDDRLGHLALIAGDNGKFDVIIRNADKQQQGQPLRGNLTFDQVQKMYGNQLIGNRINEIEKQQAPVPVTAQGAVARLY